MKLTAPIFNKIARRSTPPGFTLIELILAMAILGVLAAIALPGLNGVYSRQSLINATNEMVSTIKHAQNMAISNNQQPYDAPPYTNPLPGNQTDLASDCTFSRPYIDKYEFRKVDGFSYRINRIHRTANLSGGACLVPPGNIQLVGAVYKLPANVEVVASSSDSIRYTTSINKIDTDSPSPIGSSRASFQLVHKAIPPAVLSYFICVEQGRVYAQTSTCFN